MRIRKFVSLLVVLLAAAAGVQAQTEKTVISYPTGVSGIAVDQEEGRAYVLLPNYYGTSLNAVQVLDPSGNVLNTFPVPVASAIAVSGSGTLYVGGVVPSTTTPGTSQLEIVALRPGSGTIKAVIPISTSTGLGIVAMAGDGESNKVFASDDNDNAIAIVSSRTLAGTAVLLQGPPGGIGVNGDSGKIFASITASDGSQQVAIVTHRTTSPTVRYAPVATSAQLVSLTVDPEMNREYVVDNGFPGTLTVLSSRGATLASVAVGNFPQGLDVDSSTGLVFVANAADGSISKVSESSDSVVSTTTLSSADAQLVAVDRARTQVWVAGYSSVTLLSEN